MGAAPVSDNLGVTGLLVLKALAGLSPSVPLSPGLTPGDSCRSQTVPLNHSTLLVSASVWVETADAQTGSISLAAAI